MITVICDKCGQPFAPPSWYNTGAHSVEIDVRDPSSGAVSQYFFDTDPTCTAEVGATMVGIFPFSMLAKTGHE